MTEPTKPLTREELAEIRESDAYPSSWLRDKLLATIDALEAELKIHSKLSLKFAQDADRNYAEAERLEAKNARLRTALKKADAFSSSTIAALRQDIARAALDTGEANHERSNYPRITRTE